MRTEKQVLKDFEKLGYQIQVNNDTKLTLYHFNKKYIFSDKYYLVYKSDKTYKAVNSENTFFTIQEHKLINELFTIWNWI